MELLLSENATSVIGWTHFKMVHAKNTKLTYQLELWFQPILDKNSTSSVP